MPKQSPFLLTPELENEYLEKGFSVICGTDEAGRGPLCGPVAAAAVILPVGLVIPGLNDSKKLSEKKRNELYDIIIQNAVSYAIELVDNTVIDEINILNAAQLAMRKSIMRLSPKPDLALVDGNIARDFPCTAVTVVKGDAKSPSIAAASVLAKVTRDRICIEQDALYPQYGIAKHKGYPTAEHIAAVKKYGPSPIHRLSFMKNILKNQEEL